jgi:ribosome recycling factor
MTTTTFDMSDLKRRMQGAIASLKQELSGLRTGRASTALLDHVQVEAYGNNMPLNQLASISVPEPRLLNVQVWDRSMVHAVEKAISAANLGLTPSTEGQVLRLRIPELNEERRREIVKLAHKYAEGRGWPSATSAATAWTFSRSLRRITRSARTSTIGTQPKCRK